MAHTLAVVIKDGAVGTSVAYSITSDLLRRVHFEMQSNEWRLNATPFLITIYDPESDHIRI